MEINHVVLTEMPAQPLPWHALPEEKVLVKLQGTLSGSTVLKVLNRAPFVVN